MRFSILALMLWIPFVASGIDAVVPIESWVLETLNWVLSLQGASVLAIAAGATQAVMRFFKTSLGEVAGKYRLLIVAGLTTVGVVLGGVASGVPLMGVLFSAAFLTAVEVFAHQIKKQFFEESE